MAKPLIIFRFNFLLILRSQADRWLCWGCCAQNYQKIYFKNYKNSRGGEAFDNFMIQFSSNFERSDHGLHEFYLLYLTRHGVTAIPLGEKTVAAEVDDHAELCMSEVHVVEELAAMFFVDKVDGL